jgi:hypothetical protein
MSIDKLIYELERKPRDIERTLESCREILNDHITAADAYLNLMMQFREDSEKVDSICRVIQQIMVSIQGVGNLVRVLENTPEREEEIERAAGQILKGEQSIDSFLENIEQSTAD